MKLVIWRCSAVLSVVTVSFAACGGGGSEKEAITKAAEAAVLEQAREEIDPQVPQYLDARVGRPKLEGVRIQEQGERAATLRGRVRAPITVKPKPDKVAFLRVVPATGGSVSVTRGVTAELVKEQDEWRVVQPEEGVDFEEPEAAETPPAEIEEARKVAVGAVTALLDYDGNLQAYNRAQERFYATKPATAADFNQPGFDPPPVLARRSERPQEDILNPVSGAAWRRTNDGGEDDLFLGDALPFPGPEPDGFECPSGFDLKSLKARTVSGEAATQQSGSVVQQNVQVSGQAVVRAGDWICTGFGADDRTRTVGPRSTQVEYRATVSRLGFGRPEWFISELAVEVEEIQALRQREANPGLVYSINPD